MPDLSPEERQKIYEEVKSERENQSSVSRSGFPIALGVIIVACVVIAIYVVVSAVPAAVSTGRTSYRTVTYNAQGSGHVDLTYRNETGGIQQEMASLPWVKTFRVSPGQAVSVSAQLRRDGYLMLSLDIDGQSVQKSEAYSAGHIASVGGTLP